MPVICFQTEKCLGGRPGHLNLGGDTNAILLRPNVQSDAAFHGRYGPVCSKPDFCCGIMQRSTIDLIVRGSNWQVARGIICDFVLSYKTNNEADTSKNTFRTTALFQPHSFLAEASGWELTMPKSRNDIL